MIDLETFEQSDFQYLKKWINTEEELVQFAGAIFDFPLTKNQIEDYLKDEKRKVYRVVFKTEKGKKNIGIAELYDHSEKTNKIARVLIGEKSVRGKGIGTYLINELVRHSFEYDEKEIVTLNVYDWNIPAIKCYEKVGFVKTTRETKITHFKDENWKAIEMRIHLNKEARS